MKMKFQYVMVLAVLATMASCKKDNYDAPNAQLNGRVVYQGEALGFENYQVPYELYQFGFGKVGAIGTSFGQDGSMNALLFNGNYKLIVPNGQGPFLWPKTVDGNPDSLSITMNGSQTLDIEVRPYFMLRNATLAAAGGKVTASFGVEKIITDVDGKDIEEVALYLNKTQFVSEADNSRLAVTRLGAGDIVDPGAIALEVSIPSITPTQNYVFARVGLKIAGIEDRLYTQVQKISY